jgi:hypothetical protein
MNNLTEGSAVDALSEHVLLSAEDILSTDDTIIEWCPVPEWGNGKGGVYVRSLMGNELDDYQGSLLTKNGKGKQVVTYDNMRTKLCVKTICNKEGVQLFNNGQIALLAKKNAAGLSRVFEVATRLSGLKEEDIKEMEDNLKKDLPEDLPSVSQGT